MLYSHYRSKRTDLVHNNLEPPKKRWRFFVNWLFDSLMPGMPVSTTGASSLKSPASIWRGVVFVVFIMSTMAIFASNQVHADNAYFAGTVIDQNGTPIENATVRVNEEKVRTTNSSGSFGLHAAEANQYTISVSKPGYALKSRPEKPSMTLSFTLKKAISQEISIDKLSKGITITDSQDSNINDNTWIELPADALVDSNGNKPSELVEAHIYTYDLANESMPGDMTAKNSNGDIVYLESAGAFDAEFVGVTSGKKYNLASDKEATVSVSSPTFINPNREPPTFWYYNEADGKWVEEEDVTVLINDDGRYEAEVKHFSQMNFDWEMTKPACVKYTIKESFFDDYKIDDYKIGEFLYIRAITSKDGSTYPPKDKTLSKKEALYTSPDGHHVIYNIPANSTVELYVAENTSDNYVLKKTVNAGEPWWDKEGIKVGVPENADNPQDPYGLCGAEITLPPSPSDSPTVTKSIDDGLVCIDGKGNGVGFSWLLQSNATGTITASNPNAITAKGNAVKVAEKLYSEIVKQESSVTWNEGDSCIGIPNHTLYVGDAGKTDINDDMCQVEAKTDGTKCSFNPNIKLFTKPQMLSRIKGFLWDDLNSNGLQGWTVLLKNPKRSEISTVTDANGYYEFTRLSITGNYTISVKMKTGVTYSPPQSVVIKVDSVNIPKAVNFKISKTLPKCPGSTCNVSTNGSNGTGNGSKAKPFATIQHSINTAKEGYTVLVHPGTYVENINFNGKNITVKSTDGAKKTVIDGNQSDSVVQFINGENAQAVLDGFTITNGTGTLTVPTSGVSGRTHGGGIWVYNNSSPTLRNLIVTGNTASHGGGIGTWSNSNPHLKNVILTNNSQIWGALGCWLNSNPTLVNVTISDNENGSGMWIHGSHPKIKDSILWNNTPNEISFFSNSSAVTFEHSDVQGGQGEFTGSGTVNWLDGNIDSDPLFVDAKNGDYSLSKNSPAKKMGAYPGHVANSTGIPTLSEWGLIIFILMLTTIGILFTMRRQAMIAATSGGSTQGTPPPVLVPAVFIKALTITGLLALIGFAIGIWLSSSLPTTTDIVGTLISAPIFAYLIHLLMIFKRQ